MTNEEKARSVLCRAGRIGNSTYGLSESEIDELACAYDECQCQAEIEAKAGEFLERHHAKVDSKLEPKHQGFFRNTKMS